MPVITHKETRIDEHIYHQKEMPEPSQETIEAWEKNAHTNCRILSFNLGAPEQKDTYWVITSTSEVEWDEEIPEEFPEEESSEEDEI